MSDNKVIGIDIEAARALALWKALFADEVCQRAKELAAQANRSTSVSLAHYRQAAGIAPQSLATAIQKDGVNDVDQRVA